MLGGLAPIGSGRGRRGAAVLCVAAALAATAAALGGCGGDDREADEPADLVPAQAPLYVEAVVRPGADQRAALEELAAPLLGGEALDETLVGLIDEGFAEDADPGRAATWARDVRPWLGERAGVFLTSVEPEPEWALVVEVRDEAAARRALDRITDADDNQESERRTYEGVEYLLYEDDAVAGVVGGHVVNGSEGGLRAAVDALEGDALADEDDFEGELEQTGARDALGYAYLRPDGLIAEIEDRTDRRQAEAFFDAVGLALDEPSTLTFDATGGVARADLALPLVRRSEGGDTSRLLAALPSDAWLRFASGDAGGWLSGVLTGFLRVGAIDDGDEDEVPELIDRLASAGLDVDDLGLGDVTVYAAGTRPGRLEVALAAAVEDRDSAKVLASGVVGALREHPTVPLPPGLRPGAEGGQVKVPDLPSPLIVALSGDRLVFALGTDAARAALTTPATSADSPAGESERLLGAGVDVAGQLDLERLLALVAAFQSPPDPELAEARKVLRRLRPLALGARRDGGTLTLRLAAGPE